MAMRLELKKGINNCTIINDSYNSDHLFIKHRFGFPEPATTTFFKTLVLSDILQTSKKESELYNEVSKLIKDKKIRSFNWCRSCFI